MLRPVVIGDDSIHRIRVRRVIDCVRFQLVVKALLPLNQRGRRWVIAQGWDTLLHVFLSVNKLSCHEKGSDGCMIIYATTPNKKYTTTSLAQSCSNFPAAPAIPTALEVKPANSVAATDTRLANQEKPPGIALVANRRCRKDRNFFHISQQLGARYHLPIAQEDKEDSGISWLHTTYAGSEKTKPRFIPLEMWNF